jgi:hypothetical protein
VKCEGSSSSPVIDYATCTIDVPLARNSGSILLKSLA